MQRRPALRNSPGFSLCPSIELFQMHQRHASFLMKKASLDLPTVSQSTEFFNRLDHEIFVSLWRWAKRRHKHKSHRWIANKYWHTIDGRRWTFAAELSGKQKGEKKYLSLVTATDTKIIRFRKIVGKANPFDERWSRYFEERDGERMLNSTQGREYLIRVWRKQNRCCPICGERITSETGFKTHTVAVNGITRIAAMVHPECHKSIHPEDCNI